MSYTSHGEHVAALERRVAELEAGQVIALRERDAARAYGDAAEAERDVAQARFRWVCELPGEWDDLAETAAASADREVADAYAACALALRAALGLEVR